MIAFLEHERIGTEAVVAYFKVLFWHSLSGTEENHETFCQTSVYMGRDLNRVSPEYKSIALRLEADIYLVRLRRTTKNC
jgi:hypothetical protein